MLKNKYLKVHWLNQAETKIKQFLIILKVPFLESQVITGDYAKI